MPEPKVGEKKSDAWQNDATTKAKSDRKFNKVETNFVVFETDKPLEGKIVNRDTVTFQKGDKISTVGKYRLEKEDGTVVTFLGGTDLDDKLGQVLDGQFIQIVLTGKSRTGSGFQMKNFEVSIAE